MLHYALTSSHARRAFSMIEMLVVLTVALSLVLLSVGVLAKQMRKAAIRKAASDIIAAAEQARALSMRGNGMSVQLDPSNPSSPRAVVHYGVLLQSEANGESVVTVRRLVEGQKAEDFLDKNGRPIFQAKLPSSAVVFRGNLPMGKHSDNKIEWYYRSGLGTVHLRDSGYQLTYNRYGIGTSTPSFTDVWGEKANTAGSNVFTIPPGDERPALSVRAVDGLLNIAVGIFPVGVSFDYEFDT